MARTFLRNALVAGAATLACAVQHPALAEKPLPRVGVLMFVPLSEEAKQDFRQGFLDRGYVEGKNIDLVWRSANGSLPRAEAAAKELVSLKVDVIVAEFTPAVLAARKATKTIPIVMASVGDPVATGLVSNLAHPGGNITGYTNLASQLSGKRLQVLRAVMPGLQRVGMLLNGADPLDAAFISETRAAAREAGLRLYVAKVPRAQDLEPALAAMDKERVGAVIVLANIPVATDRVASMVTRHHLLSMSLLKEFVEAGGLMSYGASVSDIRRRVALYVDKILNGTPAGELPVEQPTKIELLINLRTARALGIAIPPEVVVRADRVIE